MIAIKQRAKIRCPDCKEFAYRATRNIYFGEAITSKNIERLSGNKIFDGQIPHCEKCKTSVCIENHELWKV